MLQQLHVIQHHCGTTRAQPLPAAENCNIVEKRRGAASGPHPEGSMPSRAACLTTTIVPSWLLKHIEHCCSR